jgi:hypothetical protein
MNEKYTQGVVTVTCLETRHSSGNTQDRPNRIQDKTRRDPNRVLLKWKSHLLMLHKPAGNM